VLWKIIKGSNKGDSSEAKMNSLQRMRLVLSGQKADRVPFAPAIYEHKAFLIKKTPSEVACDDELLYQAVMEEFNTYRGDLLTVGLDVYNIEAEALGCKVKFYKTNDVPAIEKHILKDKVSLDSLKIPSPLHDGRMPILIKAGKKVLRNLGKEVKVRGAMSGPFSLASSLCGMEKLFILTMENPDYVKHLMKFCTKVLKVFGKAYLNVGLGIVVFDSVCSLVSPKTYKELIMPYHKELMSFFHQEGLAHRPLIIGGNTLPISKYLLEVDANQILCDFNVDLEEYLKIISGEKIAIRANVDPKLIQKGPIERIKEAGCKLLKKGSSYPKFILGTGVISYNTLRENILALRKIVE